MSFLRALLLFLMSAATASSHGHAPIDPNASPALPSEPEKPTIEKIDETHYRIGKVTLDQKTRQITFPAVINMTEGLLEYLIVHQNGKVHESLLATVASPTHLNLAFTLLRYPASRELYSTPEKTNPQEKSKPSTASNPASQVHIELEWTLEGKIHRVYANELVQHNTLTTRSMPNIPWVYGGSSFSNGRYLPQATGDIAAIFVSDAALLNYPGEDHENDTVWTVFTKRVPPIGTPITVIISPASPPEKPPLKNDKKQEKALLHAK